MIPAAALLVAFCFSASAQTATSVNAASYATDQTLAAGSIAAAFGAFRTQNNQLYTASGLPLPKTLGGVSVKVNNVDAELFFTSTGQINYVVPPGTPNQTVNVVVTNSDNTTVNGTLRVAAAAPGIFSARATGSGTAAALTTTDGAVYKPVANPDGSEANVDAGTTAQPNFLILYGTAIRNAPAANPTDGNGVAESVKVTIQGVPCEVAFAGPAPGFIGLDQLNVKIPSELSGFGSLNVRVAITSITPNPTSNTVTIKIAGELPAIRTTRINAGDTVNGALTIDDQIEIDQDTRDTFFFDAYRFTGTANQTVAVDLRSSQFDATIILYRLGTDGSLNYVASDDISGGFSNGNKVNNNAMLVTVLPQNDDYLIFATTSNTNPDGIGSYTLRFTTNVITQINYGTNLTNAAITTSDIQISTGDYWDVYWFQGTQGDRVQIDLTSTAFNAYLVLNKVSGDFVSDDDNSAGGTNARISPTSSPRPLASLPETGKYIIIATPYAPNVTGSYTLSLTRLTGAPAEAAESQTEQPVFLVMPGRDGLAEFYRQNGLNSERFARRRVINR
jgi:uncharacterized protein (TIGR03437 family)